MPERPTVLAPEAPQLETPSPDAADVPVVSPNALSKARAAAEAAADGIAAAPGALPSLVDNSTLPYFPPIRHQTAGDCTTHASAYYYNTFLQSRDEELDASSGDYDIINSPRFLFLLIAENSWGALGTRTAMERLADSGCSNVNEFDYEEDVWGPWPYESAWVQALRNRTGPLESIRVDTQAGIDAMKQVLANGSCVVTRADFGGNYADYRDSASGYGISNHVMYTRNMAWHGNRHSFCIVGYDDNKSYYDSRYGQTRYGAFIIANSEGPDKDWYNSTGTGTKGFMWVAYTMFLERQLGYYNWPEDIGIDPCYDNETDPTVYYHEDRPRYRPRLFAVVGVNHSKRNMLVLTGGIGDTTTPDFWGPEAIKETDFGAVPINDSRRVAVDLTDGVGLLEPGVSKQVFVKLSVISGAGSNGTITSADFYYDPEGDGAYRVYSSSDPTVYIAPGNHGFARVQIAAPTTIYVDDDAAGRPLQDGSPEHPFATIQAGIDAAADPAEVRVMPGTYVEHITPASGVTIIGSGASRTTLRPPSVGPTVWFADVTDGVLAGFTLDQNPDSVHVRCHRSDVLIRDCVLEDATNGFGINYTGEITIRNCLIRDVSSHAIWAGGTAKIAVRNTTILNSGAVGIGLYSNNEIEVLNSILWNNADDLSVSGGTTINVSHCDISDGDYAGINGNISQDPLFVSGPQHDCYLSCVEAGQPSDSPCLDAGSTGASFFDLNSCTTRTDEACDLFTVDMGYHVAYALRITSIQTTSPEVQVQWNAQPGVAYVVEWSTDRETWNEVPVGATDTWLDTEAGSYTSKFYRVREE